MKNMRKPLLNLLWLVLSLNAVNAQNIDSTAVKSLDNYSKTAVQEKAFVHSDKSSYLAGEILWFKLYLVDASTHAKTDLSSVAYVEILDWNKQPVLQTKVSLENGSGSGSLFLPVSLLSGNYKIVAYTNWMKNFDSGFFFQKGISIVNSIQELDVQKNEKQADVAIQFFPEGGNLIEGIESKVAFKAVDQNGKSVDFSGSLLDGNNAVVAQFRPGKFGIGNFAFRPQPNQVYKAKVKLSSGLELVKDFVSVLQSGYSLKVQDAGAENIDVAVENAGNDNSRVYLIAHTRQQTKVAQSASLNNRIAKFSIDKRKLGDGISHITIFNSEMKPVAERLYFKRPAQELQVGLSVKQQPYSVRDKVSIDVQTNKEDGKATVADMSVAVFRSDSLSSNSSGTISSYLWLTSDLKGNIESPEYYFANNNAETNQALDNLLLTQGWRRFKWNDVLQNKAVFINYQPEQDNFLIHGKITDKRTNKPASNILAYLSILGKTNHLYNTLSDANGKLTFHTKKIFGPVELVLQTNNRKDSLYKIELDERYHPDYASANSSLPFNLSENSRNTLLNNSFTMQVQNVYSADKLRTFTNLESDTALFYGNASDQKYLLDKYTRFPTMEEVLKEYVSQVYVKKNSGQFQFTTYNVAQKYYLTDPPLVLLDGVPVFDEDKIVKFDPLKVKELDVVSKKYYLGPASFGGVLNFSSYKKDLAGFDLHPDALLINYEGLQQKREFYSPVYDNPEARASRLPDFRNLLYWSPDVKTDLNGKTQIDFYTSDQKGKYTIVLQGLADGGRAGFKTINFEVSK